MQATFIYTLTLHKRLGLTICFALIICHSVKCQVVLKQYSFYCESNVLEDGKYLQERIKSIKRTSSTGWRIEAIIFDECNVHLYPVVKILEDTLAVSIYQVEMQELKLSNGDKVIEYSQPAECECAYELKMELQADRISSVKVNNRHLKLTDEIFQTFPIKYLIHNGDTTGYADKYGLRQGCLVIERKDGILKTFFKDNNCIRCELWDIKGEIIRTSNDCLACTEMSLKKQPQSNSRLK